MARRGLFIIGVTFLIVFLNCIPAFAAFKDVSDKSLSVKVDALSEKGIINGFSDGTFRPSIPVTRAQMAKMISLAKGLSSAASLTNSSVSFVDVPNGHWALQYIKAGASAGIIKGYTDGKFKPDQQITRAELARMLRRAIEAKQVDAKKPSYKDVPGTYWAFNEVETVAHYQLMGGYKDGGFHPSEAATRGQIAVAVYKIINATFTKDVPQEQLKPVLSAQETTQSTTTAITTATAQSTTSTTAFSDGKIIICVDAGHGGNDPGAVAKSNGLYEKDVNLAVALKLQSLLGKSVDKVVMTRTTDEFIELNRRGQIANDSNADLFVSIHHNSFATDTASGTAVYSFPGSSAGAELAQSIQDELVKEFGWDNVIGKDDGIHTANYAVLRQTSMTAALCESAYMSNPEEAALLATDDFRQKEANAIYNGIIKYLNGHGYATH